MTWGKKSLVRKTGAGDRTSASLLRKAIKKGWQKEDGLRKKEGGHSHGARG